MVPYPIVIGHEFAGEICEAGSKVTRWKVGDRVVSDNTGHVCGVCHACSTKVNTSSVQTVKEWEMTWTADLLNM